MMVRTGTSGFSYKAWKGSFYPDDIDDRDMLGHYAGRLSAVEINNTFYRMPKRNVVESWAAAVGDTFRFSVKASRRITHNKRLRDVDEECDYLIETLGAFGDRLGAVLFQLPPNFKIDLDRLRLFLELVAHRVPTVMEFRHDSWTGGDLSELLGEFHAARCVNDSDDADTPPLEQTAPFGYLRLRRESYDDTALGDWAQVVLQSGWDDCYVFFKHEDAGSTERAGRLMELIGEQQP